jgi:porin-like protein
MSARLRCHWFAKFSFVMALLWAAPALADEDLRAVLQQVREQLKQDKLEIRALRSELAEVRKRVDKSAPLPPPGVPPREARNVVVTQQPGNLPGRSVGPPGTASGVGTPGAPQPEPAAPISSARDTIKVSLSGQVDRALLYGDDGKSNAFRNVDNIISSTRFRLVGEGRVTPETTLGTNLEMEIRPNLSNQQTITQNLPQAAGNVFPTIRQAELFVAGLDWGDARLGFGSTASYLTNEFDLSGTFIGHYVGIAEQDGGFAFRQKGGALVPGGAGGKLVFSPDGAFGPAVGSVFNNFGGLGRDDRVRYDTPVWEGFQFSTSYVDGGSYDAALRMGRTFGEFRVIAAVAGADATHRTHTPTANLGYAGVPAGFPGGSSLGGTNANPSGPSLADVSPNGSRHFDGSFSVLHESGISLTMAGGVRDPRYRDPLGKPLSPNLFYTKLGYQHDFLPFGKTAISVDFAKQDEVIFNGDTAMSYAVALVQNIDSTSTEIFASAAYQTLHRTLGAAFRPILAAWTGARIRF